MSRKESKIPLLLTLIALGFFIHWAIGFVQTHRVVQDPVQPPIEAAAKETPLLREPPEVTAEITTPSQAAEPKPALDKNPTVAPDKAEVIVNPDAAPRSDGRPINRKLLSLIRASGTRE